jgi:uncharacterized protein (DUF58 family)
VRAQAGVDAASLRICARRDVTTVLAGAYRSAFRGSGLTFEELRDYQAGDDVRWIEWNATARMGKPIVKRMREERDLVVALLVDLSDSLDFGYRGTTKLAAAQRAAAALAFAAIGIQDRVALATFAEGTLTTLAPATGRFQMERVFRGLADPAGGRGTDARAALDWAVDTLPRHTICVLISDLLFSDPGPPLRRCAHKHELVVLRVADPTDEIPRRGAPIRVAPAEWGRRTTFRRRRRPRTPEPLSERTLRSLGIDSGTLWTGARLVPSLHRFFESRARRGR